VSTQRRIDVLDLLRGVAILGTLGTNIWLFTDPAGPPGIFAGPPPHTSVAGVVETVLLWLTNGKFLGLLTILFGVGLELQYRSSVRRGVRWPGWYLWRALLLLLEGLLHYLLVFEFDVLMGYALVALIVAWLVGRGERTVRAWMITVGTLHIAVVGLLTLGSTGTAPEPVTPGGPGLFSHGTWAQQVTARIEWAGLYRIEAVFIIPLGIVLFLLGSRLLRAGVLEDSGRGALLRRRLMILGLGVAAPLDLLAAFHDGWYLVDRYLLAPLVALGLLGLVTTLAHRASGAPGVLRRALTSVGRVALSSYVLQNLLATVLCYGWGLGLAARFDALRPWWVPLAWAAISATMMTAASWWLRRHSRGPLEYAWHWAWSAPQRRKPPAAQGETVPLAAQGESAHPDLVGRDRP
jgi:uncharacterized protein